MRGIRTCLLTLALPLGLACLAQTGASTKALVIQNGTPPGAQYYSIDNATNVDCEKAIRFCGDMVYQLSDPDHGPGCLYFTFTVVPGQSLDVQATSAVLGGVSFYGPLAPGKRCADSGLPCAETPHTATISCTLPGVYFLMWDPSPDDHGMLTVNVTNGQLAACDSLECPDCLPTFAPLQDSIYVVTAWCKQENVPANTSSYPGPYITVLTSNNGTIGTIHTDGPIIDGWQRMEGSFQLPANATDLSIELACDHCKALFDDVRFFPDKASMKCFVYDPTTLRLDAELDERHYATLYEYDAEGKLTRIKKETERGIMTIQETRYNSSKLSDQ